MIRYYINDDDSGSHYAISYNDTWILVQIDDGKHQVRINISPDQAKHMADLLIYYIHKITEKKSHTHNDNSKQ